jgi:hypothetical protein
LSCTIPASPTNAPETKKTEIKVRLASMPAVRAACGLAPVMRNRKPIVDRSRSHQATTAAARAMRMPQVSGRPCPKRWGSWADGGTIFESGVTEFGGCSSQPGEERAMMSSPPTM